MKKVIAIIGMSIILILMFLGGSGMFPFLEDDEMHEGRVHVHKPVHLPSHLPLDKDQTLIFFGYVGCTDICTPRLHEIASILQRYQQTTQKDDLDVYFINLDPGSTPEQADAFAKSFHPQFTGVSLPKNELNKVILIFNAYFSAGLREKEKINHTQHLYMIHKDANGNSYLRNIYIKTPYDTEIILHDLMKEER